MAKFDAALKQIYTSDHVENMVYNDNPLLALVSKMESFEGRNLPVPIIWADPQNRSATFSNAMSGTTSARVSAFTLTRVQDYAVAAIDNETLLASKTDKGAFLEAATTQIDGCINTLSRSIAVKMYRSGYGELSTVAPTSSLVGAVLTLGNVSDVTNFEVGMRLQFSATVSSSVLRGAGSVVSVTAVDRSLGTVTVSPALSSVSGLAAGDVVFALGDREDSANPVAKAISGLEAWLPSSSPTSTPFFGVDRSVDASRLGGQRLDATAMPIEEALITAASLVAREGAKIDHFFLDYAQFTELQKALGAKVQYIDLKVNAEVGFRGIQINGPRGPVRVIPDQNCQPNRAWGLQLATWKLYSLGKCVQVIDTDGLTMLRQPNEDGVQIRYAFRGNLGCKAPGWNVNVQLAPVQSL